MSNLSLNDLAIDEDALYNELKDLPDFLSLPLPARWFKKYNIPPIEVGSTKEFIESGYTLKQMFAPKDLPPIIINEPQRDASGNIKLVKYVEPEPIDVKVVSRPYKPDAKPLDISGNKVFLEDKVIELSGNYIDLSDNLLSTTFQSSQNDAVPLDPYLEVLKPEH